MCNEQSFLRLFPVHYARMSLHMDRNSLREGPGNWPRSSLNLWIHWRRLSSKGSEVHPAGTLPPYRRAPCSRRPAAGRSEARRTVRGWKRCLWAQSGKQSHGGPGTSLDWGMDRGEVTRKSHCHWTKEIKEWMEPLCDTQILYICALSGWFVEIRIQKLGLTFTVTFTVLREWTRARQKSAIKMARKKIQQNLWKYVQ